MEQITSWLPWIGGLGILGGGIFGLFWFFGLAALLTGATNIIAAIIPILGKILDFMVWCFQNIIWPGLKNIIENLSSIIVVVLAMTLLWFYIAARDKVTYARQSQRDRLQNTANLQALSKCNIQLSKFKVAPIKPTKIIMSIPTADLPNPVKMYRAPEFKWPGD